MIRTPHTGNSFVGAGLGTALGRSVGSIVGAVVGTGEGRGVGSREGLGVGSGVGLWLGAGDGSGEGLGVGTYVEHQVSGVLAPNSLVDFHTGQYRRRFSRRHRCRLGRGPRRPALE